MSLSLFLIDITSAMCHCDRVSQEIIAIETQRVLEREKYMIYYYFRQFN